MGDIIRVGCEKCGYNKEMNVGGGLLSINKDVIANIFSKEDISEFKKLAEENLLGQYLMENKVGYCKECHELYSVPVLNYSKQGEAQERTVKKSCPQCNQELDFSYDTKICPKCSDELVHESAGMWD